MDTGYTLTKGVILAFSNGLFVPKPYRSKKTGKEMGEARYSAMFLFAEDHPDWEPIRKHVFRVAREQWEGIGWKEFGKPFRSGTEMADKRKEENTRLEKAKADMEFARGMGILQASSKRQPGLSYMEKGAIHDCLEDVAKKRAESKFFFGAEVVCVFNFRAWESDRGEKSVSAYVNLVMATGKGKQIGNGGQKRGSEVFAGLSGRVTDEDPRDDAEDDSIPFE